jgi:transglutaminase-like putative cysteine protease
MGRVRKDPSGSLMPAPAARLVGFAALALLGALEWQRLLGGGEAGRSLAWVAVAVATGAALVRADAARRRGAAVAAVVAGGLLAGWVAAGANLGWLLPWHWDELFPGLADGAGALGTVRLPYVGASPWPGTVLALLGAELLVVAALLAFWQRGGPSRGYPFLSLALLLVLVASPVVSIGGGRPVVLGLVLTALCIGFLWLERLPLRPGIGVAALVGVALAGALPLAAAADRGQPWFDYQSFAEGIGADDPIHFRWDQEYGPIDWPRDGAEILRVQSAKPYYWKAANLEEFDGRAWRERAPDATHETASDDVPEDWRNRPGWTNTITVNVRRLRSDAVVSAGTTLGVESSSKPLVPDGLPGGFRAVGGLRRGDSYKLRVHVPEPPVAALREADSGLRGQQEDDLVVKLPLRPGRRLTHRQLGVGGAGRVDYVLLHTRPFGDTRGDYVEFPQAHVSRFDDIDWVLRRTGYWRTWQLSQRLRRGVDAPLDYVVKVDRYLQDGFSYSERPTPVRAGVEPLDGFLFDTHDGYCQHFSGAMALLLRMGGVPARVASGFSPGGFSKRHDAWIVRDTDAHAWVEAWFDSAGWVTYDPTPDLTPARSQIAALEPPPPAAPSPTPSASGADGGGSSAAQARARGGVRADLLHDPAAGNATGPGARDGGGLAWWAWVLIGLGCVALAGAVCVALLRRFAGRRGRGSLPPLERAIAELEAALRRAGRPASPSTTLRQLEVRLGSSPEAVAYLRALSAARYGAAPAAPTGAQRRALRRALGDGLGPTGRLRAWWALPPGLLRR